MFQELDKLEKDFYQELENTKTALELSDIKTKYLGRKGLVADFLKQIPSIAADKRRDFGSRLNNIKKSIADIIDEKEKKFSKISEHFFDISLPGSNYKVGTRHPITITIERINDIFIGLGFKIIESPEIENEYYNFQALNIPLEHPSRDVFDTFYLEDPLKKDPKYKRLLRSQTSTAQIRAMEKQKPPLQILAPGKVYRPDATDASHSFMFHQVEGFMVDKGINFSHLKGVLSKFLVEMFGNKIKTRFRPHYFPFTEPSAEVDISCIICKGAGCSVCGQKGWLEILGSGMINPKVLKEVGYDSGKWQGFAFGMGVERIAMLRYGINDIRLFFDNDVRMLNQFK